MDLRFLLALPKFWAFLRAFRVSSCSEPFPYSEGFIGYGGLATLGGFFAQLVFLTAFALGAHLLGVGTGDLRFGLSLLGLRFSASGFFSLLGPRSGLLRSIRGGRSYGGTLCPRVLEFLT